MKQEEKAKAYDKALEIARKELQTCGSTDCDAARQIYRFFPELKENEDERIRKGLIKAFGSIGKKEWGGINVKNAIAWLEKQGEPTDINPSEFDLRLNKLLKQFETLPKEELANSLSFYLNVVQNDGTYKPDEKQGELIDKLVKYREWLISKTEQWTERKNDKTNSNAGKHCCIGAANALISARAEFEEIFDYESCFEKQGEQKPANKTEPFDKYEGLTDFERTLADICIGWIGEELGWKQYIKDNADVLLKIAIEKFNSVQDASFEQKPAWSEEDEVKINRIVACLENLNVADNDILLKDVDWLKSLRPQPKQEWSEEDEKMLEGIVNTVKDARCQSLLSEIEIYDDYIDWLKSLKQRHTWKPSEEQMNALDSTLQYSQVSHNSYEHLNSLYNDLKKLTE